MPSHIRFVQRQRLIAFTWIAGVAACSGSKPSVCVPGVSIACVGPGGCAGGQSCNAEGSAYLTCACSAPTSSASSSSSGGTGSVGSSGTGGASGSAAGTSTGSTGSPCQSVAGNPCARQADCGVALSSTQLLEACVPDGGGLCADEAIREGPTCAPVEPSVAFVAALDLSIATQPGSFFLRVYYPLDVDGPGPTCASIEAEAATALADGGAPEDGDGRLNVAYWGGFAAAASSTRGSYDFSATMVPGANQTLYLEAYSGGLQANGAPPTSGRVGRGCIGSRTIPAQAGDFVEVGIEAP